MIKTSIYILLALILDAIFIAVIFVYNNFQLYYLFCHILSCIFVFTYIDSLKKYYLNYNNSIALLLSLTNVFLPIFGVIFSIFISYCLFLSQKTKNNLKIESVPLLLSEYNKQEVASSNRLVYVMNSSEVSVNQRVDAMLTVNMFGSSSVNKLIRNILPDDQYELRMLAFNILYAKENKVIKKINALINKLDEKNSLKEKAIIEKSIALNYWELVYSNLIDPLLVDLSFEQVNKYADLAKQYLKDDSSLWFLLGRIYLRQKNIDKSIDAFNKAIKYGASVSRVNLYLAEIYFKSNNYNKVKEIMKEKDSVGVILVKKIIYDYWNVSNEEKLS
ncbi:tetratricopeptide repeat protein [Gammaproteobacteria bacterium]|nr:tetratricopeptide repeat protein [Gammaproteobacteria bacterium]